MQLHARTASQLKCTCKGTQIPGPPNTWAKVLRKPCAGPWRKLTDLALPSGTGGSAQESTFARLVPAHRHLLRVLLGCNAVRTAAVGCAAQHSVQTHPAKLKTASKLASLQQLWRVTVCVSV